MRATSATNCIVYNITSFFGTFAAESFSINMTENNKIFSDLCRNDVNRLKILQKNDPSFHWSSLSLPKTKETCLHLAAQHGHFQIINYLLTEFDPKSIDVRNCDNKTPLHEAAQFGHYECVKLLINHGADINAIKRSDWTPLMLACTKVEDNFVRIVELLLNNGALVNFRNKDGWTCLHLAARNNNPSILKTILKNEKLQININTNNGRNALHISSLHGNLENIKLLISHFDPNSKDSSGNTAFHEAVLGGKLEVIDYLATRGADVTILNKTGSNALHLAAGQGSEKIIQHLIFTYNFDINAVNSNGYTPLHCAARKKNYEAMRILSELGAKLDVTDKFGRIPQDLL